MKRLFKWLKRKYIFLYAKIVREKATPEYIARGWAIGMFYGCAIPMGGQLACSIPTAFLLKGSKIGATLGTFITNHFTVIFIYPIQCYIGNKIIGGELSFGAIKIALNDLVAERSWEALTALGWDLISSFLIGGILFALIMTPLTYYGVLSMIKGHQNRREKRKLKSLEKLEKKEALEKE